MYVNIFVFLQPFSLIVSHFIDGRKVNRYNLHMGEIGNIIWSKDSKLTFRSNKSTYKSFFRCKKSNYCSNKNNV